MVLNDDRPLKIINAFENKSASIMKFSSSPALFIYVVKFLDEEISKYITELKKPLIFTILLRIKV